MVELLFQAMSPTAVCQSPTATQVCCACAVSPAERVDPIRLDAILQPAVIIAAQDNGITLRWDGKTGRTYQLFTAADVAGPWTAGPVFHGTGAELVFTDKDLAGPPRRFYQIRVE